MCSEGKRLFQQALLFTLTQLSRQLDVNKKERLRVNTLDRPLLLGHLVERSVGAHITPDWLDKQGRVHKTEASVWKLNPPHIVRAYYFTKQPLLWGTLNWVIMRFAEFGPFFSFSIQLFLVLDETRAGRGTEHIWSEKAGRVTLVDRNRATEDNSERGTQTGETQKGGVTRKSSTNKCSQAWVLTENWWNVTNDNNERKTEWERMRWPLITVPIMPYSTPTHWQNKGEGK